MIRVFALVLLSAAPATWAQALTIADLEHARSMGMGGAYRATGLSADSVVGNPAAMALMKVYQIDLSGDFDITSKSGFGTIAMRDSQTSDFAAGLAYDFLALGGAQGGFAHLATMALALPIADVVSLGVSGHYLYAPEPHPANAATFDAGIAIRPIGSFIIGASAHNIVDTRHIELPRYYSGSLAYLSQNFTIAADIRSTLRKDNGAPILNVGGEYLFGQSFFVRAGYSHDFTIRNNFLHVGAGFTGQGGGVDLAYRQEFGGDASKLLVLTLRLQF